MLQDIAHQEAQKALLCPCSKTCKGHGKPDSAPAPLGPPWCSHSSSLCFGAQQSFLSHLTSTLHSLESHKPHTDDYLPLIMFCQGPCKRSKANLPCMWQYKMQSNTKVFSKGFKLHRWGLQATTAQQQIISAILRIKPCTQCTHRPIFLLTFICFLCVYISPTVPCMGVEQEKAGGGAVWSAPGAVPHQFHFRDLWAHQVLSSRQHIGNVGWGRGEWNSREKERRQRPQQWWSHGKSAPPHAEKGPAAHCSPGRERKSAHTTAWLSPACCTSQLCSWCKVSDMHCLNPSPLCKHSS